MKHEILRTVNKSSSSQSKLSKPMSSSMAIGALEKLSNCQDLNAGSHTDPSTEENVHDSYFNQQTLSFKEGWHLKKQSSWRKGVLL